ncbi:hypothetical protein ElyMa_002508400 [Elysia marginata]|uniref:Uncharacterized protein n=1 Tax=Elysia marginata TaxID=1093978 RepID=A0AAV4GTC2_9GAST|nr:hypothetical protein ElyMa_002508400 [Elysia marginata]
MEMAMDWRRSEKAKQQHNKSGAKLKPTANMKLRKVFDCVMKRNRIRCIKHRDMIVTGIMTDAVEDHFGTASIGGRPITTLWFANDIDG